MKEKKSEQDTKGNRHTDTHTQREKSAISFLSLSLKFTPSRYSTTLCDEYNEI